MDKMRNNTGYLKKRLLIDASFSEEKKISDFIEAHKLPKSFYLELRLREMDNRLMQRRYLEETLKTMTEKRRLIVEWNLTLHMKAILKILRIFTKSSGAICYVVDQNKTHLLVVVYIGERRFEKSIGEAFKISDCLCLATSAASHREIMLSPYLSKDYRFPLGNGWPECFDNIALAVPIMNSNCQVLAVIELTKTMFSHEYSSVDTEAVSLLTSLFGYLAEESEITTEIQMILTFINPMMKLITQYLECTLPVAGIISQLTFMSKNELRAVNSSFCVKKTIRNQQYNVFFTEDSTNSHCHVETSKISSRSDKSFLGYSMRAATIIKGKERNGQDWLLAIPIKFNEVTGGIQFQFLCLQEPNISEKNKRLLEITCTFLGFILEMNELVDELFKHEKEIIVIEDMLKLQTCNCNHELLKLQDATDSYKMSTEIYSYTWSPEITNNDEKNLLIFCDFINTVVGHLFDDRKSLNEFILFIKRTHVHNKEIYYRHVLLTTHFIATFLKNNEEYFSPIERDALVMSALCHYIHKCEPVYSFIYVSIFKTFRICENLTKLASSGLLNKMKRWKYFYPCNYLSDCDGFAKKYREIVNLIGKKKFNCRKKCHRELVILTVIINADKSMYYKHKIYMSHHDEYCYEWNIPFCLHKEERGSTLSDKQLWTPKLLDKSDTDDYRSKKRLAICLINSFLQPWFNVLKILFQDTEFLQHYIDLSKQTLRQHEKEIKEERRKTFVFTLKPTGLWDCDGYNEKVNQAISIGSESCQEQQEQQKYHPPYLVR